MSGGMQVPRVVLLFGSEVESEKTAALASESSQLALLLAHATGRVDVSVISLGHSRTITGTAEHVRLDESGLSITDRVLATVGAFSVRRWCASFPLGRLFNTLGPVDQGRVFWRTVRNNSSAMRLLKSATVVIATDAATTKTAWLAVHRRWVDDAFYDQRTASVGISWQLPATDNYSHG